MIVGVVVGVFSRVQEEEIAHYNHACNRECMGQVTGQEGLVGMAQQLNGDGLDLVWWGILLGVALGHHLEVSIQLVVHIVAGI